MNIPNDTMQRVLETMPESQRRTIESIIKNEVTHEVYCDSGTKGQCKNRLVGHLYKNGTFHVFRDEEGKMWVRAYRRRMDGNIGFECWCGNDSRISKQEEGIFDYQGYVPNKDEMAEVLNRVKSSPSSYPTISGVQHVDGFTLKAVL